MIGPTLGDEDEDYFGDEDEDEEVGDGQNWAFFTLEILISTPRGVTSPITVTFLVGKSILNDVTPATKKKKKKGKINQSVNIVS